MEALLAESAEPLHALHEYPGLFRKSLANDNRLCLGSFLGAPKFDDLPDEVKTEVQTFADINVAWLSKVLLAANAVPAANSEKRAPRHLRRRRRRPTHGPQPRGHRAV